MWYKFSVALFFLGLGVLLAWLYLAVSQGEALEALSARVSGDDHDRYYRERGQWSAQTTRTTNNISATVFNDVNRNGIYDAADRTMMRVAVRLHRPDGSTVVRRTNVQGFANFTNSLTAGPVDVSETGEYSYEVLVPNGWTVTTGNRVQSGRFEARPDSRPGIVIDRVPQPVGLARDLFIEGRAGSSESGRFSRIPDVVLTAVSPQGEENEVELNASGQYRLDVEPGKWMLRASSPGRNLVMEREVEVKDSPVRVSTMALGGAEHPKAPVEHPVDFDEVTRLRMIKMQSDPEGLHWSNIIVMVNDFYNGEGYINNTVSGGYVAYNTSGHPTYIERAGGFDFVGAFFGIAWSSAEGEILDVRAWRGDEMIGEDSFPLSTLGPVWFDADYRNITRLEIATRHYWQFVMDNPVFRLSESAGRH